MKNNRYKILVLSDMKETTESIIKSGISLAKMIDGEVHFFYVKKPTEIVEKESQLSAMRTINKSFVSISKNIQNLIGPISKDYDIEISCNHAFGNVKSEINDCIKSVKPDIVVLGQRKSSALSFLGDNITDFVIKNHNGAIMIVAQQHGLEPYEELSLGVLNDQSNNINIEFADRLFKHTQKPLKSFRTYQVSNDDKEKEVKTTKNIVELVFDRGDNSIKSLSNYLTKSDVNLLCLDRRSGSKFSSKTEMKNTISTLNVSLLISEG